MTANKIEWTAEDSKEFKRLVSKAMCIIENTIRAIDGIDGFIGLHTDEIFIGELKAIKETLEMPK